MVTLMRRLGALLLVLLALVGGLWGYLRLAEADRQPPQGATFVWTPARSDAYLFATNTD